MQHLALVVEDDPALRLIYRRLLNEANFEVLEAADGAQALTLLETNTPQLIFLDMLLPNVNGQMVLDYVNSIEHFAKTYIAVVSSNRRFEPLVYHLPMREFILKPIRPAQIREIAQRVTEAIV
jgi:CheY-like chemotaxis protein